MCRLLLLLISLLHLPTAHAWNAAGHRLSAVIAWQTMQVESRTFVSTALARHPDYPRWREKAGADAAALIFAEASTWPDSIRHDPRFTDHPDENVTPLPGFPDMGRRRDWHYADIERDGRRGRGEIDRQIDQLSQLLRSTAELTEIAWALPWLAHLVADIHQPLHVGYSDDRGGNSVLIENPLDPKKPFSKLHSWWDDLPGPTSLRGKRLWREAGRLLAAHPASPQATRPSGHTTNVQQWLQESRQLLPATYPPGRGSVTPLLDPDFANQARQIAEQRIVAAGRRLARQLDEIHRQRAGAGVSRETARAVATTQPTSRHEVDAD